MLSLSINPGLFKNKNNFEEKEIIYPWNNEQLNFYNISDFATNKEEIEDFKIPISEEMISDKKEENIKHKNENVVIFIKIKLNYNKLNIKKKEKKRKKKSPRK